MTKEDKVLEEIKMSDFQVALEKASAKIKGRVGRSLENSFSNIKKSWKIREVDPAMASLRAITAEEEAASALMLALKKKRYPGADKLDHNSHVHKAVFTPFITAVNNFMAGLQDGPKNVNLIVSNEGLTPKITMNFPMDALGFKDSNTKIHLEDPLDLYIRKEGVTDGDERNIFDEEIKKISSKDNLNKVIDFIRAEANARNKLLYASDTALPENKIDAEFIEKQLKRVAILTALAIMINQTARIQIFAVQCLESILRIIKNIEKIDFDFSERVAGYSDNVMSITRRTNGEPVIKATRKYKAVVDPGYEFYRFSPVNFVDVSSVSFRYLGCNF